MGKFVVFTAQKVRSVFDVLKFILGVLIIAFTSFCGYLLAGKYRKRKLFFRQLCEFNQRFLSEIDYYRRPIEEFAAGYAYKGEFHHLLETFFQGLENRSFFDRAYVNAPEYSFLKEDEKNTLEDYFLMLGRGDSSSQKGYFSSMKDKLILLSTNAENAYKKYGDLYIKIGFLCGLLLLILII